MVLDFYFWRVWLSKQVQQKNLYVHTQSNYITHLKYFERKQTNLRFKDSKHKQDDKEKKIDCYHSNMVNVSFCILIQNTTFCNKTKQ